MNTNMYLHVPNRKPKYCIKNSTSNTQSFLENVQTTVREVYPMRGWTSNLCLVSSTNIFRYNVDAYAAYWYSQSSRTVGQTVFRYITSGSLRFVTSNTFSSLNKYHKNSWWSYTPSTWRGPRVLIFSVTVHCIHLHYNKNKFCWTLHGPLRWI